MMHGAYNVKYSTTFGQSIKLKIHLLYDLIRQDEIAWKIIRGPSYAPG